MTPTRSSKLGLNAKMVCADGVEVSYLVKNQALPFGMGHALFDIASPQKAWLRNQFKDSQANSRLAGSKTIGMGWALKMKSSGSVATAFVPATNHRIGKEALDVLGGKSTGRFDTTGFIQLR